MRRLNKRATEMYSADTVMTYIVFSIVLSFALVGFMFVIFNYVKETGEIPKGIEEFSAIERFQSRDCFALKNTELHTVISWNKFTNSTLSECYNIDNGSKKLAFTLKLQIPNNAIEIKTNNWNKELYPKRVKKPIDVNVYYNNKIINGELIISEQNV